MKNCRLYLAFLLFLFAKLLVAQPNPTIVKGQVLDLNSGQPVEFATIMIGDKKTKQPITGATSNSKGHFELKTESKDFFIEISFIGFTTKTINEFDLNKGIVDLGIIKMSDNINDLDEVVVRAEKSTTEFKLDKRVFNVGKDLSSTGAGALEVLNNVPSVNVNIEGQISLRGSSGVQILINGKPSVIASEQGNALGTITADMIQQIEIITNPSAKYDAEGTSGIINIVLKKEERKGINGSATLNLGVPHNHSIGLSLNRRTEQFNLFMQVGAGYREMPSDNETINRDLLRNTEIYAKGREFRNETFYNLILGTDYHINKNNVITLSGSLAYEIEDQPSRTAFQFMDETGTITDRWTRTETTEATNPKYQYELQYKKDFTDNKDHDLLFSVIGNLFAKDQSSEFVNQTTQGSRPNSLQQTRTDFGEEKTTIKLDYTKPFSERWTMETGAQYVINDVSNDFAVTNQINGEWVEDPSLTNIFEYNQKVFAVYGTGAYEDDRWGLKLGLRLENTDLKTLLVNTDQSNNQKFSNFFPTAHTSFKVSENFSLQAGYSKRIFRPRLWDLNPFFNIRNNFSIRTGNPNLLPEYTDSYEVQSIYILGKFSMNFGVYHRYTTDVVERVSTFENNINTSKPINVGTNRATGVEYNFKYSASKKLTLNGDVNYNYFNRKGELENQVFDFNADQWSGKLTTKIKFSKKLDFEVTGHYRSKFKTVQRVMSANTFADLGLRYKIMKGQGIINLSIRDLFASRFRESVLDSDDFYLYSYGRRGRFIVLGFSYGFGKGEAMELSGEKRRGGGGHGGRRH